MTKEFIDNGNELIAVYVGATFQGDYPNGDEEESRLYYYKGDVIIPENWCRTHSHTNMRYHKNWEWLMPVAHKLMSEANVVFATYISDKLYDQSECKRMIRHSYEMEIEVLFRSVLNYIQYLNAEKLAR